MGIDWPRAFWIRFGIFLAPMLPVVVAHFVLPELIEGKTPRPTIVDPTNLVGDEVGDPETDASESDEQAPGPEEPDVT